MSRAIGSRPVLVAASVLALCAIDLAAQPPQTPPAVFPSRVDLVTVDAVVVDRQGQPVEGLTERDFTVKENGEPQTISAFQAVAVSQSTASVPTEQRVSTNIPVPTAATGRWFFIVFDDVNMSQFSTPRARDAIVQFIERTLRDGDHVMIAPASGRAWLTAVLPADRERLVKLINALEGDRRPDTTAGRIWDHEAMAIALGRDPQALAQVARRYYENNIIPEAYPTDPQARRDLDVSPGIALIRTKSQQVYKEALQRLHASLGTLDRMCAALTQARGRKTLLLFSEGFIMDPAQPEFRAVVQSARAANAAIYFVDVNGPEGMMGKPGMPGGSAESGAIVEERDATTTLAFAARESDGARSIALNTGGRVISGSNLGVGLARVATEARSYYLLGYTPTNRKRDGTFRKIEVVVNRPGVEVLARGGYYAASDKAPPRSSPDQLDANVRAALESPFGVPGIPLRLTSYVFGPKADGTLQTTLLAEADPAPLRLQSKDGQFTDVLDSYVLVHDAATGRVQRDERVIELSMPATVLEQTRRNGLPIRREFALPPGRYSATLVVRERATALIGSVRHEFVVPAADAFRASTPIITDAFEPTASGRPAPVAIARRTFHSGARVACAFDIFGAARNPADGLAHVTLAYRLLGPDGREVSAAARRPLNSNTQGQVGVVLALTLPASAAGNHTLHVTVHDELANKSFDLEEPILVQQ
jgi:VWFA-related protein